MPEIFILVKRMDVLYYAFFMITGRPALITGIRTVFTDGKANEFYSSLRKGVNRYFSALSQIAGINTIMYQKLR